MRRGSKPRYTGEIRSARRKSRPYLARKVPVAVDESQRHVVMPAAQRREG